MDQIQFWDEGGRLNMNYEARNDDLDLNEGIMARFRRCLEFGIRVAGRKFLPLSYSASQARTHALWAFAPVTSSLTRLRVSRAKYRFLSQADH